MDQTLRKISERHSGKIICKCGNKDWAQFLYVGDLPDGNYRVACKKCARIKNYDSKTGTLSNVRGL